jgi:hypothetical protein
MRVGRPVGVTSCRWNLKPSRLARPMDAALSGWMFAMSRSTLWLTPALPPRHGRLPSPWSRVAMSARLCPWRDSNPQPFP